MRSPSLSFSLSSSRLSPQHLSSVELAFSATAFFTAHPVESYVPGYPLRRLVGRAAAASRCFSAHRAFFSLSLSRSPVSLSLRLTRPTLLAILVLPAREERERLARNPPQNKRRVAAAAAVEQRERARAPTLPYIFNYRLVTESLG